MREIKFRVWSEENGLYIFEDDNQVSTNGVYLVMDLNGLLFDDAYDRYELLDHEDYIIEQYTGLKDKNGVEIYEGDIVKAESETEAEYTRIITDVLFNSDGGWQLRSEGKDSMYTHGLCLEWGGWTSLEVIGNIHEEES